MTEKERFVGHYEFGPFRVAPDKRLLWRGEEQIPLMPKVFDTLLVLLESGGRVLGRDELMDSLWPDTAVEENNLTHNISALRKALGEGLHERRYILTVPGRGYRFVAEVRKVAEGNEETGGTPQVTTPALNEVRPPDAKGSQTAGSPLTSAASWREQVGRRPRVVLLIPAGLLVAAAVGMLYVGLRHVWTVEPAQPHWALSQVTFDPSLASEPSWSPDGRFLAYSSDRGGNFDIWVKPVGEGESVQVTKSEAHDWQPDWSPDGTRLVFRSERGGGGLFVIPALGGGERKVSAFGYRPRWSPDGSQILFYSAFFSQVSNLPKFYLVGLDGKPPREVLSEVLAGMEGQRAQLRAAWHPDGQRVSFCEQRRQMDWGFWTVPVAGGQGVKSEFAPDVERRIKEAALEFHNFQWAASGRALFLEGNSQGVRNLWRVEVDPHTLRWMAGPERLTTGAGPDTDIAPAPDGRKLAFTTRIERTRIWSLPFDAAAGKVAGTGQPMTAAGVDVLQFDLSRDGQQLAFLVNRAGKQELRKKSLADGSEMMLVAADGRFRYALRWMPDGTRLTYVRRRFTNAERTQWEPAMVWLPANGGDEQILAGKGAPYDWSADGKWMLNGIYESASKRIWFGLAPISAAPRAETETRLLASDPGRNLFHARFSPNERWIVFLAVSATDAKVSTLYVIPAAGGVWTRVTEGQSWDDKPQWSPDGRTIYFISNRGGYYNTWGIRFDPVNGKPVGEAFRVTAWEGPGQMISPQIGEITMALTTNRLFVPITEASGNVWVLENVHRRGSKD